MQPEDETACMEVATTDDTEDDEVHTNIHTTELKKTYESTHTYRHADHGFTETDSSYWPSSPLPSAGLT